MKYHRLAFIDTETTGLDPNFHEVIEIGCVVADWKPDLFGERTLVESSTLDIKIIPEHIERADPKALAVNHYAKRDWSQAISRKEAIMELARVAKGAIFIAQNVTFDWSFLQQAAESVGIALDQEFHFRKLDLASIAFGRLPDDPKLERYTLRELSQYFGIRNEDAHTALSDARTAFEIYRKLLAVGK